MVCAGRKESEKERESARGRGKEEERKTSAEAIGGVSVVAATTFSQCAFHLFSWNSIS
jgi:hypothetical protein